MVRSQVLLRGNVPGRQPVVLPVRVNVIRRLLYREVEGANPMSDRYDNIHQRLRMR
jgi:hypothetical protein